MAQKYDLNSAGSDEPLDMMDKKSLDRETISFCRNLVNIRTRVADEWTSMQVEAITKSSKEFMEHFLSYLDDIMESRNNIADQNMRAVEIKELIQKVDTLEASKTAMESEMADQQKKIEEENNRLETFTEDLEAFEKVTFAKKDKVNKALSFFKERIGLRFKTLKSEDQIKVIFDQIDANNLEREFSFHTKIIDSKYLISQCEPPVEQLDAFVEELNISNDYGKFILMMRKAFKSIVMTENDQNTPVNVL